MIKNISFRFTLLYCAMFLSLLLLAGHSYALERCYTIQTGSFAVFENAQKQFDSLKQELDSNDLDYLRIENINGHFKVRIGNFENSSAAEKVLQAVIHSFPDAIILNVSINSDFINDKNIIMLYRNTSLVTENKKIEGTPVMAKTPETESSEKIEVDVSVTEPNDTKSYIDKLITEEKYDEAIEEYRKAIDGSQDSKEKAQLHKELGEIFVLKEEYRNAAEDFIQALSLSREFPEDERLQMAIYISWGDRLDEAIAELESILNEDPGNVKARVNLAKVLSWAGRNDEAIVAYRKVIKAFQDNEEKAKLHKELGDIYVTKGDFKNAAKDFIQALSLSREFPEDERLQMAIYISWGDRLDEAIAELESILNEDPGNVKARVNLAKVLSWAGRNDEAIEEAEKVLKDSPDDKEALLVKSNSLKWKGKYRKAIPLYKSILAREEGFDARLGLAYSYLNTGNITATRRSRKLLEPEYPYQEEEFKKFNEQVDRATRPNLDLSYSFYEDSDDNIVNRYLLGFGFWLGNWKNYICFRHTDAKDNTRNARDEDLSFMTYSKITESFGVGGGLGLSQVSNDETSEYMTGHLKADLDILNGTIGVGISRDVIDETAEIIENGIRVTNTSLYISQELTEKLSLYLNYIYRDYSDDNNANDFAVTPRYLIYTKNPTINLGYRFRYLNFNRQSGSGYFDPNDFISHQIFVSLYYEKGKFYSYLEPFIGHQTFKKDGEKSNDVIGGGYGYFGIELSRKVNLEINAEGGNYAMGTAAGWNYFMAGLRLLLFL